LCVYGQINIKRLGLREKDKFPCFQFRKVEQKRYLGEVGKYSIF